MNSEIDLASLRSLIKRGAVKILPIQEMPSMLESAVIFDDVAPEIIRARCAASVRGDIRGEWFLVTDRPRGREWVDDVAVTGLFVIEVEDLAKTRDELTSLFAPVPVSTSGSVPAQPAPGLATHVSDPAPVTNTSHRDFESKNGAGVRDEDVFAEIAFEGKSFAHGSIPLKSLKDMVSLQAIITNVSAKIHRAKNPGKGKLPKGFVLKSEIHMTASLPNCFTVKLVLPSTIWESRSDAENYPLFNSKPQQTVYHKALLLILSALEAVGRGAEIPADFPRTELPRLHAIGRELKRGEYLLVRSRNHADRSIRVDEETRNVIERAMTGKLTPSMSIIGEIENISDSKKCTIRTGDYGLVEFYFDEASRNNLAHAFHTRPMTKVCATGDLLLGRQNRLSHVSTITIVQHERSASIKVMQDRIDAIVAEGNKVVEGKVLNIPSHQSVGLARIVLGRLIADQARAFSPVISTREGRIEATWTDGSWTISCVFSNAGDEVMARAERSATFEVRNEDFSAMDLPWHSVKPLGDWLDALK